MPIKLTKVPVKITQRQRAYVKEVIANPSQTAKSALIKAGYSPNTAIEPQQVIQTQGVQYLLAKHGLTKDFIINCVKEDIDKKPQNRAAELSLASKITGLVSNQQQPNQLFTEKVIVNINLPENNNIKKIDSQ